MRERERERKRRGGEGKGEGDGEGAGEANRARSLRLSAPSLIQPFFHARDESHGQSQALCTRAHKNAREKCAKKVREKCGFSFGNRAEKCA